MRLRERRTLDEAEAVREGPPAGGDPAEDDGLRQAAARLLAAADDAIARALSGDSEAFLAANRQEGGQ